jgi:gamma-glutamyltranspeptidase / glutathione hydrolase
LLLVAGCASAPKSPQDGPAYSEAHLDFGLFKRTNQCCSAQGQKVGIASGGEHASAIGMEIANRGGNAVDIAVATAFALSVERPHSAGLGGGGFMLVKLAEPSVTAFLDFRETAPHKAKRDMYLGADGKVIPDASLKGPFAVGVPGFVAGMFEAHSKWGKLPWKDVLAPAAKLAREGFAVYPALAKAIADRAADFKSVPYTRRIYLKKDQPLAVGDTLVQKDLGDTIEAIGLRGRAEFYAGKTGERLAEVIRQYGGILSEKDLAHYEIRYRQPIAWQWKGYTFLGAPPPSAAGILQAQMLKVLEGFDLEKLSRSPGEYVHLLSEVMKRAYADRSLHIGDPDFHNVPQGRLMSDEYAEKIRGRIDLSRSTPSSEIAPEVIPGETHGTTHVSVLDSQGNAVTSTITINGPFGSGIVVPRTGIILNNEMDDFSIKPGEKNLYGLTGGEANAVAAGKRPVSSMSPTIVLDKGTPVLAVGGAGGSRILSSVTQVALNYLAVYPGDLKKAVFAPRMHHQWVPDRLDLDAGFSPATVQWLKERHHEVSPPAWNARVEAVGRNPNGTITAVFDPRDAGGAQAQ